MAKLPENFGYAEKPAHPYRALVVTVAVLIGGSLFAGGMFYQSMQDEKSSDITDAVTVQTTPKGVMTAEMQRKLSAVTPILTTKGQTTLSSNQADVLAEEDSKTPSKGTVLTKQQLEFLLR